MVTNRKIAGISNEPSQIGFPNRSDTSQAVPSQKEASSLKFRIEEEEGLYYPCSENNGADQLYSYCTADLRLCFRLCMLFDLLCSGLNYSVAIYTLVRNRTLLRHFQMKH